MKATRFSDFDDNNFWSYIRKHMARFPGLVEIVALYFAFVDPETPAWAKAILGAALLYFVLPLDAVPDWIPVAGFVDDIAVAAGTLATAAGAFVREKHRVRARRILGLNDPTP